MSSVVYRTLFLIMAICLPMLGQARPSGYSANNLTLEFAGRGLYQKSAVALYNGTKVTLEAPVSGWLDDMNKDQLKQLKGVNLNDLSGLARLLQQGLRESTAHFEISVQYRLANSQTAQKVLSVIDVRKNGGGNIEYILNKSVDLPADMENAVLLFKIWPSPMNSHATCCDCSGGCAALWILFSVCTTCLSPRGGEDCCEICDKPFSSGESCP